MSNLSTTAAAHLPWDAIASDDTRFRRILLCALGALLILAATLPLLQVAQQEFNDTTSRPLLTRVTLEKIALPEPEPAEPPPVEIKQPEPITKAPPKPEPTPREVAQPEAIPEPVPDPARMLDRAREEATAAGVLAFRDELESLRDSVDVESLNTTRTHRGQASAAQTQRAVVSSRGPATSGGIRSADISTDTGGPALSGKETTVVHSTIGGEGGTNSATAPVQYYTGGRSDEEIRRVMDRNKGAIFALYNRALRRDPLLEGKIVFEMVIDPDGSITELTLLSSGLGDDELTGRILSRINMIRFSAAEVLDTRVNYSFDFLPYT